jgi:hypothetical protein
VRKALSVAAYAARTPVDVKDGLPKERLVDTLVSLLDCVALCMHGDKLAKRTTASDIGWLVATPDSLIASSLHQTLWPLGEPEGRPTKYLRYNIFLSHASEDKAVAQPLADALGRIGLRVWFDAYEIAPGHSLRRRIEAGISQTRWGVALFSKAFFKEGKQWISLEMDGLSAIDMVGRRLIPIWYDLTQPDIVNLAPAMSMRLAIEYESPEVTANKICNVLENPKFQGKQ